MQRSTIAAMALLTGWTACAAQAELIPVAQQRTITAASLLTGATNTLTAPDFAPFIGTVNTDVPFLTPNGIAATTTAVSTINCFVDPNGVRAAGSLLAGGGVAGGAGGPTQAFGEARAIVIVSFEITQATAFSLSCLPRPLLTPGDTFEFKFRGLHGGDTFIELSEADPAQAVNLTGILQPGEYELRYHVELSRATSAEQAIYDFNLVVPSPQAGVVLAGAGLLSLRRRRR
jgi:hypothetical protein